MSSYLDQEIFEEKPQALIFNNGKAGVVNGCVIKVEKKGPSDRENAPEYKIIAFDSNQSENKDAEVKVYPVNKGFFKNDSFKSKGAEKYAVNELRHLLRIFGHKSDDKGKIELTRDITSYNDFLDYTFAFINSSIKENNKKFDVVVDYGNGDYPSDFLRLNGYPWYIGEEGASLSNKNDAILERPSKDSETESTSVADDKDDGSFWTED